jgi:nitrate reductase alpha subunit
LICFAPITALDRGLGGGHVAASYDDDVPYTPAWQEKITGVARDQVIRVARAFADNAEKTKGRSMIIIGRSDEPLVSHGHELPCLHQHAGILWLCRPVWRRLGALCGAGKTETADRLDAARLRA